jgi:hypothetical protein
MKVTLDTNELELITELLNQNIKTTLTVDTEYDEEWGLVVFQVKDLNICRDINWLVQNETDIEELRFHDINTLIEFIKERN